MIRKYHSVIKIFTLLILLNTTACEVSDSLDITPSKQNETDNSSSNDNLPVINIENSEINVKEGDNGTTDLELTLSLSSAIGLPVTVAYTTEDGTATRGSDYTATSGTLTFAANTTTATIAVPVKGDTSIESDETFKVVLSNPDNATIDTANSTATATITNDDFPAVSIADAAPLTEGNSGTTDLEFTVTLSAAIGLPVTVAYTTEDGTATKGSDYTATSGTLTFAANTTTATIAVPIKGDTSIESDETFKVVLSNPDNATMDTANSTATATITNDDFPAVSIADAAPLTEGNSGTTDIRFTVTLSGRADKDVTVNYSTSDDSATAGEDYIAQTDKQLTFPANDSFSNSQEIIISVLGDTTIEADETFRLTLSNPSNATISKATATATIINDDFPVISIEPATSAMESSKQMTFNVILSDSIDKTVTFDFTIEDISTSATEDYTAPGNENRTVELAANMTSKSFTVDIIDDSVTELNETFRLTLSNPTNATLDESKKTAIATIINDDTVKLNDSGITSQVVTDNSIEDAMHGRDVTDNDNNDGHAGFSFTRLGSNGQEVTSNDYLTTPWSCIKDNVTGLTWEVKEPSTRFTSYKFSEAIEFVATANTDNLCGYSDWRLPTREELRSIVDYSANSFEAAIDINFFPNTAIYYWSSSDSSNEAWLINFTLTEDTTDPKDASHMVRLVRGSYLKQEQACQNGQSGATRFTINDDGTVSDNQTGLMWKQCAEGTDSDPCNDAAATYTWEEALAHVQNNNSFAGYDDWRLPNLKELASIADLTCTDAAAINTTVFPSNSQSLTIWTASPRLSIKNNWADKVWLLDLATGAIQIKDKTEKHSVRLVRDQIE